MLIFSGMNGCVRCLVLGRQFRWFVWVGSKDVIGMSLVVPHQCGVKSMRLPPTPYIWIIHIPRINETMSDRPKHWEPKPMMDVILPIYRGAENRNWKADSKTIARFSHKESPRMVENHKESLAGMIYRCFQELSSDVDQAEWDANLWSPSTGRGPEGHQKGTGKASGIDYSQVDNFILNPIQFESTQPSNQYAHHLKLSSSRNGPGMRIFSIMNKRML